MKFKNLLTTCFLGLTLSLSSNVLAMENPFANDNPEDINFEKNIEKSKQKFFYNKNNRTEKFFKKLDLNSNQIAKMHEIETRFKPAAKEIFEKIKDLNINLKLERFAEQFDGDKIQKLIDEKSKLQANFEYLKFCAFREIFDVLTEEQKQKYLDIQEKRKEKLLDSFKK